MKKILSLLATGCLALAANNASAIPLQINIDTNVGIGAGGAWSLWELPATFTDGGLWGAALGEDQFQSWLLDIDAGAYEWRIGGGGLLASVSWSLNLDGVEIFSGSAGSLGFFEVHADKSFDVISTPTQVPEPGVLLLLGGGLLAFATVGRRKAARV